MNLSLQILAGNSLRKLHSCKQDYLSWKSKDDSEEEPRPQREGQRARENNSQSEGRPSLSQRTSNICPAVFQTCHGSVSPVYLLFPPKFGTDVSIVVFLSLPRHYMLSECIHRSLYLRGTILKELNLRNDTSGSPLPPGLDDTILEFKLVLWWHNTLGALGRNECILHNGRI